MRDVRARRNLRFIAYGWSWVRRRTYEADSNKLPIARQRWIGQQREGEENNGPRDKSRPAALGRIGFT